MLSLNTGDTGFVMLCTALVCMMTPALALFYGGMVRKKNVLTIMMQNFISMGVTAIIWIFGGFSLAFGPDVGGLFGDISYHFALDKVGIAPSPVYASTVPFILFFAYQLMFAVIAPALITGAFAGRLNFRGYLKFLILWMIFIYIPVCHWIWGGGWLAQMGFHDFAGSTAVHMVGGVCALIGAVNGTVIARLKVPPFIATLGTMFVARGVAYMVNGNRNTNAIASGIGQEMGDRFQNFFYYGDTLGLYNTFWIAMVLFAAFFFLLSKTRTGRHIYAIGSNADAAKLSGVSVVATVTKAYLVAAFCSFVVGLILCAQASMGNMEVASV